MVKGADIHFMEIHLDPLFRELIGETGNELLRSLYCIGNHHNLFRRHFFIPNQIQYPLDDSVGLTGSGARNDQCRTIRMDCIILGLVFSRIHRTAPCRCECVYYISF